MDPKIKCPFKIGSNLTNVSASYLLNKTKLTIQSKNNHVGNYPDFGSALEVYTNQHFLEIEVMGKIVDLKPHQKTSVVEK
jgi:hypothetical protein